MTSAAPDRRAEKVERQSPSKRSSIGASLFSGRVPVGWLVPFPAPPANDAERVGELAQALTDYATESIRAEKLDEQRWIGDDLVRDLADRHLMGLGIPKQFGGQGLSMTGFCGMFEAFARVDIGLGLVLGIHQSIGTRGIVEFGTDEQRERLLPDLASARRLSGFALTEPWAGSDAHGIRTRAVRQPDGSWRLNGEKCHIGNAGTGSVFITFAKTEVRGRDRHIALIVEKGMSGFEVGRRTDTMGLRANDVGWLHFKDVRVPPENVLGEPGEGYRIALRILENGRLTLGAGAVGGAKKLLDLALDHACSRRAFGRSLIEFELVQERIAWMLANLFAIESMTYLTAGIVDKGLLDTSLETALCKITGTEFLLGAANRALDLRGGAGYLRSEPYERILRDVRVFPIFEGSNDVLRPWIALNAAKVWLAHLEDPSAAPQLPGSDALPAEFRRIHDHAQQLAAAAQTLLLKHGKDIVNRQVQLCGLTSVLREIYAQAAVMSRSSDESLAPESGGDAHYGPLEASLFIEGSDRRIELALQALDAGEQDGFAAVAARARERRARGLTLPSPATA